MLKLYLWLQPVLLNLLRLLSLYSPKLSEIKTARHGLMERWYKANLGENRIWVHVSSVGELEQSRPVISCLGENGKFSIVLSYFSTSVPKLVRNWKFVQFADYIPFDIPEKMRELILLIRPRALILIRYDLWPAMIFEAKAAGVPVILVNASTPPTGLYGELSLRIRRSLFSAVDAWAFVDAIAADAWGPFIREGAPALVTGNPRVDQALIRAEQLASEKKAQSRLARWERQRFCLVAGSTWPQDESVLFNAWARLTCQKSLVVVPHEPDEENIIKIERELGHRKLSFVRFSHLENLSQNSNADVLVVDQRGFLAEIYGIGSLAYVGGGFGRQIHSIIEPIAHGLPVAFGPNYDRTPEAATLVVVGAAYTISGMRKPAHLAGWMELMRDQSDDRQRAVRAIEVFIQIHKGAGERVGSFIEKCLNE